MGARAGRVSLNHQRQRSQTAAAANPATDGLESDASGDVAHVAQALPSLDELRTAHKLLMARFYEVISWASPWWEPSLASNLIIGPDWMKPVPFLGGRSILSSAALARRHVRRRLRELADTYMQLAQSLPGDDASYRTWLDGAASGANEFADTLPVRWGQRLLPVGVALAPTVAVVVTSPRIHIPSLPEEAGLALVIGCLLVLYAAGLTIHWVHSYRLKRRVFLGSPDLRSSAQDKTHRAPVNIYDAEDRLFLLLGRRKVPELRIDLLFPYWMLSAVGAGLAVAVAYALLFHPLALEALAPITAVYFIGVIPRIPRLRQRWCSEWR